MEKPDLKNALDDKYANTEIQLITLPASAIMAWLITIHHKLTAGAMFSNKPEQCLVTIIKLLLLLELMDLCILCTIVNFLEHM